MSEQSIAKTQSVADNPEPTGPQYSYDPTDWESWKQSLTDPVGWVKNIFGGGGSSKDMTAVAQKETALSTGNAQEIYRQALADAAANRNLPAPTSVSGGYIQAPQQITTSSVQAPLLAGSYQDRSNTQAAAVDATPNMVGYQAAMGQVFDASGQLRRADVMPAADVAPARVGAVDTTIKAPTVGEAAQTGGVTVGATTVDPIGQAARAEQLTAARSIASAPSASDAQFRAAEGQVVNDQLAIASAARGAERAGARREALIAAGQQGGNAALAAAALAAKEEQDKRVAAATALSGIRSQDLTAATTQAGIDSQRATLQAQLDAAIAQGNTAAINTIKAQQASLESEAAKASLSGALSQQATQAGLEQANLNARQQTSMVNTQAANKSAEDYAAALNAELARAAAAKTAMSGTNAAATTKAAADLAAAKNAAATTFATNATQANLQNATLGQKQGNENANRDLSAAVTNAANALEASKLNAANTLTANTAGVQLATDVAKTNAGNALSAAETNAANELTTTANRANATNAALTTGVNAINTQSKNAQTITDSNKSQSAADAQRQGALLGAAGSVIGAVASDERVKSNVRRVSDKDLADLADAVRAVTYEKAPGFRDGANRAGELAQELERSTLGRRLVTKRPDGIREVDYMGLAGMMAAAAASASRKLRGKAAHA